MPAVGPIKRRDLIKRLKQLGFSDPRSGGSHEYIKRGRYRATRPNPHEGEISQALHLRILRQAGGSREEWEAL